MPGQPQYFPVIKHAGFHSTCFKSNVFVAVDYMG